MTHMTSDLLPVFEINLIYYNAYWVCMAGLRSATVGPFWVALDFVEKAVSVVNNKK